MKFAGLMETPADKAIRMIHFCMQAESIAKLEGNVSRFRTIVQEKQHWQCRLEIAKGKKYESF